ncbi:helix-turn-helix transcriptional regulator [Duganella sp. BK701]
MLRCKQLMARLSLSRSTIYDKLSKSSPRFDPSFPRPINLGPHAVGWVEAEVDAWLQARIAASR